MTRDEQTVGSVTVSVVCDAPAEREAWESPTAVARHLLKTQPQDGREHFRAVYLDARHRPLAVYTVSIGCLTASLVHAREVFRPAIVAGSTALVVSHNHPSGDPEPSPEDIALTRRLVSAGTLIGIQLLDHIVTGAGRYVSFADRGLL